MSGRMAWSTFLFSFATRHDCRQGIYKPVVFQPLPRVLETTIPITTAVITSQSRGEARHLPISDFFHTFPKMKFNSLLLLVSSTAIPVAVARATPDGGLESRSASISTGVDFEELEGAVKRTIPGAGDGDVHDVMARLEEGGFDDLLGRADNADPGLA